MTYISDEGDALFVRQQEELARKEAEINNILARQDLNRQLRYNSNARIWAKQAKLGRKGK